MANNTRFGKIVVFVLVVAVFVSLLSSACASRPPEEEKVYEFKYATCTALEESYTQVAVQFSDRIREATDGRVRITIYPSESLCSGGDQLKAVSSGSVDMTEIISDYVLGEVPLLGFGSLPGVYDLEKTHLIWENASELITETLAPYDIVPLNLYIMGSDRIYTKTECYTMSDFSGLKLRSGGGLNAEFLSACGLIPVTLTTGEMYMALKTGTIDASSGGFPSYISNSIYEICPFVYDFPSGPATDSMVINSDVFNSLPQDIQRILIDEGSKFAEEAGKYLLEEEVKLLSSAAKEYGCIIYKPTPEELAPWGEACQPLADAWVQQCGHDGEELFAIIQKYAPLAGK